MTTAELTTEAAPTIAARFDALRAVRCLGAVILAALPGLLTLYLSFNAGGYFPGSQGIVAAVLGGTVALRMAFTQDAFAGFGRALWATVAVLALYSLWCLVSSHWSHSPSRALLDFDLANIYLFAVLLFGSAARTHRRVHWMLVLTWLALLAVCVASLATRLRPDLFPIPQNLSPNRLAFPLTYWNALGLFGVIGMILALYLATSTREPRVIRVLATAAIPLFGMMVLLTYSRSAIIVGAAGLIVYALLARPRGLPSTLLTAGPTSVFVIAETYQAKLISNADTSVAAIQQGRHLTTSVLIACIAAALGRVALLELDTRLVNLMTPSARRHNARIVLALSCGAMVLGTAFAFGGQISHQWSNFTKQDSSQDSLGAKDVRNRISNIRIGSRLQGWRIAIHTFDRNPVHGQGAGTFATSYDQLRTGPGTALEAHSLYLEAMSELGVVGLVAVVAGLAMLIAGCFVRSRRASRSLWIALGTIGLVWAVHAGIDWDWEMPAATLPVIALTASALGRRGGGRRRLAGWLRVPLRGAVGLACVAAAIIGLQIAVSDRAFVSSVNAFNSGNCLVAKADAAAAISAVSSRPQPYEVIGYCDVLTGMPRDGVTYFSQAVTRDPTSWRYHYGLAVALAAAGRNPHRELAAAERLDPFESMIVSTAKAFQTESPRRWERAARTVQMPVSTRE